MNYMLLLYSAADAGPKPGSPEQAAEMPQWLAYSQVLVDAGVMGGRRTAPSCVHRNDRPLAWR
ncbi:MAG: hypothetical protein R2710_28280 [Acidimicrobiales bacterium]